MEKKEKLRLMQESAKKRIEFWATLRETPYATGIGVFEQKEFITIYTYIDDILKVLQDG